MASEPELAIPRYSTMEPEPDSDAPSTPRAGATTELPHDRIMVQRFREAFPRARWSDRLNAWFVPGRTAERRIGRWLAEMEAAAEAFPDEKDRDAFAFDPIESHYLAAGPSSIQIRTPYSRTIINEIRDIPFARWDADRRLWTVPSVVRRTPPAVAGNRDGRRTQRA